MRSSSVAPGRRSRARPSADRVGEGPVPELVDEHRPRASRPASGATSARAASRCSRRRSFAPGSAVRRAAAAAACPRSRPANARDRLRGRLLLRRPGAEDVAHVHLHVRLVERDPEVDAGTEPPPGLRRETTEALGELRRRDAAAVRHPEGQGEVQERHRGRDPRLAQLPHEVAVARPTPPRSRRPPAARGGSTRSRSGRRWRGSPS